MIVDVTAPEWETYQPPVELLQLLVETVGIQQYDGRDILHRRLIKTLADLGRGASVGDRIAACRLVVTWELREAAHWAKTGKANYDNAVSLRVLQLTEEARVKGRKIGESIARRTAETENFDDRMMYLQQEARATAMRHLLSALESALDNHRTDRADLRAGDRAHAGGYGSHA